MFCGVSSNIRIFPWQNAAFVRVKCNIDAFRHIFPAHIFRSCWWHRMSPKVVPLRAFLAAVRMLKDVPLERINLKLVSGTSITCALSCPFLQVSQMTFRNGATREMFFFKHSCLHSKSLPGMSLPERVRKLNELPPLPPPPKKKAFLKP